ncbi:MAG: DDE-type integrase/transposase/recombinase [Candidatus Sabulitectum sp.]|nr:DDE-type integrase/transposase/recombinase [Candidatus Sabulitectum sp.]
MVRSRTEITLLTALSEDSLRAGMSFLLFARSSSLPYLVCNSLRMAISRRGEASFWDLIHHSDRGSQYASEKLGDLIAASNIRLSMSRKGDPWDNAMMESFFNSLKSEWISSLYSTRKEAELEVFKYIEMFYNPVRLHESLDYITPLDFERKFEQDLVRNEPLVERSIQ